MNKPTRHRLRLEYEGQRVDEPFYGTAAQFKEFKARRFLELRAGTYVDPKLSKMKFGSFIEDHYWKAREKKGVRESSLERERPVVARMVERWGDRSLRSISTEDLETFLSDSPNSDATKQRERGILGVVFGTAHRLKLIPANPAKGVTLARSEEEPDERVIPTPEQVAALVEAIEPKYRVMLQVMAWCGLRPGEAAGLRRCDVLLDSSELWVRKSVFEPSRGKPFLTVPKTKSSIAKVEMPSSVKRALAAHILQYGIAKDESLLFPGADDYPLRLRSWRRGPWARACRDVGLDLHPHSLRHFYVSVLISEGFPLEKVSRMARHKSPMVTWTVYAHELQRKAGEVSPAVAALERLMSQ